ncbi:Vacuolar sorting protein 26 [Entamoeba marina]
MIGSIRYTIRCVLVKFSKVTKEIEIGVRNPQQGIPMKELEVPITDPIPMNITLDSVVFELNDIIQGTLCLATQKLISEDVIHQVEMVLVKYETFVSEKMKKESAKIIKRMIVVKGQPMRNEKIPIFFVLPTELLTPSFQNIGGLSVSYQLQFSFVTGEGFTETSIPIELWRELDDEKKIQQRKGLFLGWMDNYHEFNPIVPEDFPGCGYVESGTDEYAEYVGKDDEETNDKATERLKEEQNKIKKITFDW